MVYMRVVLLFLYVPSSLLCSILYILQNFTNTTMSGDLLIFVHVSSTSHMVVQNC